MLSFPEKATRAIHLSPKLSYPTVPISVWKNVGIIIGQLWIESFDQTDFERAKPVSGQDAIFAEFSREDYSCDSFISKAGIPYGTYFGVEKCQNGRRTFVGREFRPNVILATAVRKYDPKLHPEYGWSTGRIRSGETELLV